MTASSRTTSRIRAEIRKRVPIQNVPTVPHEYLRSTWKQARPGRIRASFDVAQSQDPGGWYVVGRSGDVGTTRSVTRMVAGREIVLWRDEDGTLMAGPGTCPHLGALLDDCEVIRGDVVCRWHGMALGAEGQAGWKPVVAHDDGVLAWVRLPTPGETPTDRPTLTDRPPLDTSIAAVIEIPGVCEPPDIIANRLDPWHGAWYHPYAFSHLVVDNDASDDKVLVVDVTFRLTPRLGVPVRAEFACPDARTIVMTIVDGEGAGSVVETHATPIAPDPWGRPRTMMTEATIAHSSRTGFQLARAVQALVKPPMKRTAARLWVDDMAYAERRYLLRARGDDPAT
ncbi:MAG TPA: DUF5914 domain-containing protein [Lapillicoccus sp.]